MILQSGWGRSILVLAAVPVAMFKNAVRIVGISLLAIHVDMKFLTNSSLHRDGGILFYLLGLFVLAPLLLVLQKFEKKQRHELHELKK